ncbi:hypothetical protein JOC48_002075 [Aquibacillus albus]|uniref:YHYH domain-containing protein n=1 Tax=Aquibacillus albus TaxID=1168171 RepID=A0ABS2N0B6_9BACI|nr:YHYH domain-containing protein [Aquibacillus albus]MBM7571579.1 hypothetical protein [Aquibacillus albus]
MRKVFVLLLILIYITSFKVVLAHPGNTDSNGGHYCRTNCEEWGYNYGEYHYHDNNYNDHSHYPSTNQGSTDNTNEKSIIGGVILLIIFVSLFGLGIYGYYQEGTLSQHLKNGVIKLIIWIGICVGWFSFLWLLTKMGL